MSGVRPSNGAEGDAWMLAWCRTCEEDVDEQCAILTSGLIGNAPSEWRRGPLWSPQTAIYCTAYRPLRREGQR